MEIKLSPSILSADFANLARDIKIATDAGAEYVHVDVMDGHFVPNITIGAPVVKALRKATDKVLDVHLMISDPDQYLDDFIKAGSDIITVHYESNGDTLEQLKKIRAAGVKAACVIKPKTPAEVLFPLLPYCDMVLIMTVEPGFGGQGVHGQNQGCPHGNPEERLQVRTGDRRRCKAEQYRRHRSRRCRRYRCRFCRVRR